jgi:hypothetical protein
MMIELPQLPRAAVATRPQKCGNSGISLCSLSLYVGMTLSCSSSCHTCEPLSQLWQLGHSIASVSAFNTIFALWQLLWQLWQLEGGNDGRSLHD